MARFKAYNYDQVELIPVSFNRQILPGTFEHALVYLIDYELDLSIFDEQYANNKTGRLAYSPSLLLKIILLAYSRGITSSRKIAQLCCENVLFMAISANIQPHFTTLADFISRSASQISALFVQVLMICDEQGLIGREMFAVDGCKLPGNASKKQSGTHQDLKRKQKNLDEAVQFLLEKHKFEDRKPCNESQRQREEKRIEKYRTSSQRIRTFLAQNQEKMGRRNKAIQSNMTDPDSAKMKSSHGVIQGYIGVATVDAKHQVIVSAEAFGESTEHGLLEHMLELTQGNLQDTDATMQGIKVLVDSGYHSKQTLKYIEKQKLDVYLADTRMRQRDKRFDEYKTHYKPKPYVPRVKKAKFKREDFFVDLKTLKCVCPAGQELPLAVASTWVKNTEMIRFRGKKSQCTPCSLRSRCLGQPDQVSGRTFAVVKQTIQTEADHLVAKMQRKVDTEEGREIYSHRLGLIEPVFGHLTSAIGIKGFRLRGKAKVNLQWKLYCLLHNALKLHRVGWQMV